MSDFTKLRFGEEALNKEYNRSKLVNDIVATENSYVPIRMQTRKC